jgi:hypothetical protein
MLAITTVAPTAGPTAISESQISFRLPLSLSLKLDEYASKKRVSVSGAVRVAVEALIILSDLLGG